jgi:ABC-type multidrug transport system fused ATPase/permease subunit
VRILKRLFAYVQPYWKPLLLTAIAMLLATGLSLLPPLFQRAIIDGVLATGDTRPLWPLIAGLVGVYALLQAVSMVEQYVRHVLGARFPSTCACGFTRTCNGCRSRSSSRRPPAN